MGKIFKFKDSKTEISFLEYYNEISLTGMRFGFKLAVILYALFGLLDPLMLPVSYMFSWQIRFGIVIPLTVIFFFFTFLKSLRSYLQVIVSLNAILMGVGIIAMIAAADESEPGYKLYYAGLMLVIMSIPTIFRLRFFHALFSSTVIILGYEVTSIFIQKISAGNGMSYNNIVFISNNFFFISANIIGLIAAYYFEYFTRINFLQHKEIVDKHQHLNQIMKNINVELEMARNIQLELLPTSSPQHKDMKVHAVYKPMEELGGDFYDFIKFQEQNLTGFFISDVSGHGIPAALITGMLKTLIVTSGNSKFFPSQFLKYINSHIINQIGENFLTAVYMLYDSESRVMKLSRGGHPYPLLIRRGEVSDLISKGGMIGIIENSDFEDLSLILEPGDKILLYTDGLTEELNHSNEMFEETLFQVVLPRLVSMSVEDIVSALWERLVEFKGDDKISDDICIVGIEIV
jgi:hypothetical protein